MFLLQNVRDFFLTNDMPNIIVKRELPTQRVHGTMDVIQSHILYLEHM